MHQLTDANGTILWEALYQPFGETAANPGSTVVNNWRMPGQYYDAETGLHYNYFRYYDAATGRYLTPDPIGLEGGINLYAYVQNNPVNLIDPYGLKGGVLIPLRNYIKNNIGAGDILGPILDQIVSIPYTPPAAFFYIMGPKDVGEGSSRYTFEPQDYDVIPMDWSPYNPKYWDVPEDGVVLKQGPCE